MGTPDPAKLAINSATVSKQWTLRQLVGGCVRAGIRGITPWRDKLQECGVADAARHFRANGLIVPGLCRGGFFTGESRGERQAALDENRRDIDEAVAIGAGCLILVVGGLPHGSKDLAEARAQFRDAIGCLLTHARPAFRSPSSCCIPCMPLIALA